MKTGALYLRLPHPFPLRNEGFGSVGTSKDTSEFAVDNLLASWVEIGQHAYRNAKEILLVTAQVRSALLGLWGDLSLMIVL